MSKYVPTFQLSRPRNIRRPSTYIQRHDYLIHPKQRTARLSTLYLPSNTAPSANKRALIPSHGLSACYQADVDRPGPVHLGRQYLAYPFSRVEVTTKGINKSQKRANASIRDSRISSWVHRGLPLSPLLTKVIWQETQNDDDKDTDESRFEEQHLSLLSYLLSCFTSESLVRVVCTNISS